MTGAVWYAILIYILGMALVLYIRPSIMFKPSGLWKEFGVGSAEGYTVFPFWMFSLIWAITSYAIVSVSSILVSTIVQKSNESIPSNNYNLPVATPISQSQVSNISANIPMASKRLPGYYILENLPEGPRYIYWGAEAPTMQNVIVRQSF